MSAEQPRVVTVRLNDVQDLFEEPGADSDRYVSGMEEIYRAVKAHTRVFKQADAYQVTIEFPSEQLTASLADEISAKIKRYCQFKADESQQGLMTLRLQGIDSVRVSVLVLIPCLILGVLCTWLSQRGINNFLEAVLLVLAAIFILSAGWVALWMPAEFFLYDTWPFQQDMRVYQQIAEADLVVSPNQEETAGAAPMPREDSEG